MFMRLMRTSFDPSMQDEGMRLIHEVVDAFRLQPGFQRYYGAVDRTRGVTVAVTTWDTEEHAQVRAADFGDLLPRLQEMGMQFDDPEIYEVVIQT